MEDQIPLFYTLIAKGKTLASSSKRIDLLESIQYFKDALKIKETDDVLSNLCIIAIKLNDVALFEQTALRGAELGYKDFFYELGRFYSNIRTSKFDIEKAVQWYKRAIEEKSVPACKDMAAIYIFGKGKIMPNSKKAEYYLLKALEINDPLHNGEIHNILGLFYRDAGQPKKAFEEFMKSANLKYKPSYINVALAYRNGYGIEKDIEKYADYLFKDVNYDSAFEIGMLYFCGLYTAKDERLANIYFRYATSLKHPGAALMYAAYLASQEKMDEKEIFSALEIVFKYGMIDDYLRINYEIIEDSFDGKVCEKVKELAKKYWNITKGQA